MIRNIFKTISRVDLNVEEWNVLNDSIRDKYIPAFRNAVFLAILGTPGMILTPQADPKYMLTVIASVTGIAWFAISLKEIKQKFSRFGLELTSDMLQAFLTTLFTMCLLYGYQMYASDISVLLDLLKRQGVDIRSRFLSPVMQALFKLASVGVGGNVAYKLFQAVHKYDVNDAMFTGSAELARRYFSKELSELAFVSVMLKQEHSLSVANYQIANGLRLYMDMMYRTKFIPPAEIQKSADGLIELTTSKQDIFDKEILSVLKNLFAIFSPYIESDSEQSILLQRYKFVTDALDVLNREYQHLELVP